MDPGRAQDGGDDARSGRAVRLLVTGGAGYIGSVVTTRLLDAGHEVVVLDDLSTGHRDAVPGAATLQEGDVCDPDVLSRVVSADLDAVVHLAARSLVGESVRHPERYWSTNVCGTRALLDAVRHAGITRFVFSSSAATYGEPEQVPIEETAPTRPSSPYGASKLAVDLMLGDEARAHGLSAISLRYFNVAGALGDLGERHDPETHLIPNVLRVAAGQGPAVTVFGTDYPTPDGTAVRDYLHVDDLATAHLLALGATGACGRVGPGHHRVYNLGNGTGFSVRHVVSAAREVTGHPVPVIEGPRRAGDPAVLVASSRRIHEDLGWTPTRTRLVEMVADAWRVVQNR
ncbi:MAG: UDP-glucose 4-epimerase GalE [Actinomycetes bacterium]